jgi:parallel beta-helix repeat protein
MNRRLRPWGLGIAALALLTSACAAAPTPPPEPCASGAVFLDGGPDALQSALDLARPGDVLQLADTSYSGRFVITASGTLDAPITLCGSAASALDGGDSGSGYALHLDGASHWVLDGFAVSGAAKGIMLDAASSNELRNLEVSATGDEGIHLRSGSSDNTVRDSVVHDTGLSSAEFGEGIYVGSAESNWCRYTECQPDASNGNRLVGNTIHDTAAEPIDIKEGTTGGLVQGNTLTLSPDAASDSAIDLKGNEWLVYGNDITASALGVQVQSVVAGWGQRNHLTRNVFRLPADALAIDIANSARAGGNVVGCDNVQTTGAPAPSNVTCS